LRQEEIRNCSEYNYSRVVVFIVLFCCCFVFVVVVVAAAADLNVRYFDKERPSLCSKHYM
jgi:hypothetical protein